MKSIFKFLFLAFLLPITIAAKTLPPFNYDVHQVTIPGTSSKTIVLFHGMGGNYQLANIIKGNVDINDTLVSFNFPDYGYRIGLNDPSKTAFGTINEILPAIYVLKDVIIDQGKVDVDLYGFSAGGGAIINALGVLNSDKYDAELKKIGVSQMDKKRILDIVQKGFVILDVPLKSVSEIKDFRGPSQSYDKMMERFQANDMDPIKSIRKLTGLALNVIIFFQVPDEVLSNRDDMLFIDEFKKYNSNGITEAIFANEGGHSRMHYSLWQKYLSLRGAKVQQ